MPRPVSEAVASCTEASRITASVNVLRNHENVVIQSSHRCAALQRHYSKLMNEQKLNTQKIN
jgi:hypothetical protein